MAMDRIQRRTENLHDAALAQKPTRKLQGGVIPP